jgi:polyphosphate kinase
MHLSTGNYNATTSKIYTDLGLLTANADLGEDATNLFNLLTGICQFQKTRKMLIAPFDLHSEMTRLIQREQQHAERGLPARIIAKMNSLVDPQVVQALYTASQAGVKIDLIVRGICCLRPGVKGLSENITVRSIVDRFLEHSRIFYFENACQPDVFVGSADWMPRNFFRRIELVFPIEAGGLRDRVINEILALSLGDNVKARVLQADGTYKKLTPKRGSIPRRSQREFMDLVTSDDQNSAKKRRRIYPLMKLSPAPRRGAGAER